MFGVGQPDTPNPTQLYTEETKVVPLFFQPTALVSNTGVRLQESDLVGMWHDKLSLDMMGTVLSSTESDTDKVSSPISKPLINVSGISTPPTPPMRLR